MIYQMLISSSLFIVLVLLVRVCMKNRIPGRIYVILWDIVLLRLILPLKISILPGIPNRTDISSTNTPHLTAGNIGKIFFIVWGMGFCISLIVIFSNYYRERMILSQSLPIKFNLTEIGIFEDIPIRVSDQILSPVVYGIWKPCVILPKSMDFDNVKLFKNILLHERTHIFWKDNLVKSLSVVILCLYWFDPFVWVLYYFLSKDMEFACDEEVIRTMDYEDRKQYALCIYEMADYDLSTFSVSNRFGRNPVKERIVKVMKFKKHKHIIIIFAIFFTVIFTLGVFASNRNNESQTKDTQEIQTLPDHEETTIADDINDGSGSAEGDFGGESETSEESTDSYDLHPYYRTPDMTDEEVIEIEKLHEYNRNFFENKENR